MVWIRVILPIYTDDNSLVAFIIITPIRVIYPKKQKPNNDDEIYKKITLEKAIAIKSAIPVKI